MNRPVLYLPCVLAGVLALSSADLVAFDEKSAVEIPMSEVTPDSQATASVAELTVNDPGGDDLDALLALDVAELGEVKVTRNLLSGGLDSEDVQGEGRQVAAGSASASIISGGESGVRNTTDAGALLGRSSSSPGVYLQQRSPIISDPRIRGYRFGQYLARADGAFWNPARLDLDSILSKIDSNKIEDIVVINGPFSSRYGPGFGFIDIVSRPTPRFENSLDWGGRTGLTWNSNGDQWNGNQLFEFGEENWGASVFYSHLTGSDYKDGSGRKVPSSYKARNLDVAAGFDLTSDTSLEFRYLHQDQTDVELPGQFTDIDVLTTNGFTLNLTSKGQSSYDLLTVDSWYNETRTKGSGVRSSKQSLFNSVFDAPAPRGGLITLPRGSLSQADVSAAGYTTALTWGESGETQLTVGSDLRHTQTELHEVQSRPAGTGGFRTGTDDVTTLIPKSSSSNPGLFSEMVVPFVDGLKIKTGGRVDWVSVDAGQGDIVRRGGATRDIDVLGPDRQQDYALWSAYISGDYELSDHLIATAGFGMAQRPPTATELYAMRPFESILQQGLNRIQGYPFLKPESLRQLDIGLKLERERFRGSVRGFYSWIDDYITQQGTAVDPTSTSSRITSVFVNTPEATLAGGEAFGEWDVTSQFSLFGSAMYVEGQNRTLNQQLFGTPSLPEPPGSRQGAEFGRAAFDQTTGEEPLPQIPPLESRLGFRIHDDSPAARWGAEFLVRIVDDQDRVANRSLLEESTPGFTTYDVRGFLRPTDDWTLTFGVLNITDKHYREHLDNRAGNQLYQPGITGFFGTEFTY